MLTLAQPIWLVLLIPLGVLLVLWPLPTRLLRAMRIVALGLIVLALCQPAIRLPDRSGTVVIVADRSESMPPDALAAEKEAVDLIQKAMGARDLLAVVAFGQSAVVERPPQRGDFAGFNAQVGPGASNLGDALETALALIPPDAGGRVLVLSDGKWTGRDPGAATARAAGRGIAVDHRHLSRPGVNDLAIASFQAPESVLPGQGYLMTAWVQSPIEQEVEYALARGTNIIAAGKRIVPAGLSRLLFRDRALQPGTTQYQLTVKAAPADPVPENNAARALVGVKGTRSVLAVANTGENSGLVQLLRAGRVDVVAKRPSECRWSLEELSKYSAVLVENVMANHLGGAGMETLAAWVETTGSGLMMTGGKKSFAPGGYFGSPIERILPVSMEMRREHRKLSLAIVVALDRSGSMQAPVGNGKRKIDLANIGTVQVLDMLGPADELGVIAVDSSPHVIVDLNSVDRVKSDRGNILSIDSQGGGIFIYEALVGASQMILKAKSETRHIILFADAADSEEPGRYRELLAKCREAGITVSVIGLGTDRDVDAPLLIDIAKLGEGNIYFTDQPTEIPRIFAQDTFTVARSTFVEQETTVKTAAGFGSLGGLGDWKVPALGGYNLCYIRPEANLAIVTEDEYAAPAVAAWQAGSGRVLAFMGEADGQFAGPLAQWGTVGDFYSTLVRWTAGEQPQLPDNMLLTQEVRDGVCTVQLHLDPERKTEPFAATPVVKALHGIPGQPPAKMELPFAWKSADLLEAVVPIRGRETVLNTVAIPGLNPVTLAPVCLPYSPEFAPTPADRGKVTLERISAATAGEARVELPSIWKTLPVRPRFVDLALWLVLAALLVFLAEVLERRTGMVSRLGRRRAAAAAESAVDEPESAVAPRQKQASLFESISRRRRKREHFARIGAKPGATEKPAGTPTVATAAPPAAADPNLTNLDALREARRRASERHGRFGD
jgi:Mg-chelatase subunit ChlD